MNFSKKDISGSRVRAGAEKPPPIKETLTINRLKLGGKSLAVSGIALTAVLPLMFGVYARQVYGYAEDLETRRTEPDNHSTFHYELTRTLARAAGFPTEDAERIAVANQATDSGSFKGDARQSPTIELEGTERLGGSSETIAFYHFPRREAQNSDGDTYPGGRDLCTFFKGTSDPCVNGSEVTQLDEWAFSNVMPPNAPVTVTISIDGGQASPLQGQTLEALGVYLHGLADSYSHELCMEITQLRTHDNAQPECSIRWHRTEEFGVDATAKSFTIEAGQAVWMEARRYAQQQGFNPLWKNNEATAFIEGFVSLEDSRDRRNLAIEAYEELNAQVRRKAKEATINAN